MLYSFLFVCLFFHLIECLKWESIHRKQINSAKCLVSINEKWAWSHCWMNEWMNMLFFFSWIRHDVSIAMPLYEYCFNIDLHVFNEHVNSEISLNRNLDCMHFVFDYFHLDIRIRFVLELLKINLCNFYMQTWVYEWNELISFFSSSGVWDYSLGIYECIHLYKIRRDFQLMDIKTHSRVITNSIFSGCVLLSCTK